ncbi:hypothetical protein DH2020_018496 [Rehmannia glutinosa]|uniref:Uncharacterized protein n=1 Tax=Rehmannia glutinosa TaxID=99300 RepID=A0ABR0WML1_REHGL
MDHENGGNKATGIRQIVRLKGFLQKWQNVTLGPKDNNSPKGNLSPRSGQVYGGISPAVSRRLRGSNVYCDSDEDSCQSPEPPFDVPKGYLAVYVGPGFGGVARKVEEEFGFDHSGGLTIPCEIETFKYLLQCMENHQKEQSDHQCNEETFSSSSSIDELELVFQFDFDDYPLFKTSKCNSVSCKLIDMLL